MVITICRRYALAMLGGSIKIIKPVNCAPLKGLFSIIMNTIVRALPTFVFAAAGI